jgi:hypothetical protein
VEDAASLILGPEEIQALTGYRVPSKQLEELRRQGFWRARRAPITGRVILERSHYHAVCGDPTTIGRQSEPPAPELMPI